MYSVTFLSDGELRSIASPTFQTAARVFLSLRKAGIIARFWQTATKGEPRLIA